MKTFLLVALLSLSLFASAGPDEPDLASLLMTLEDDEEEQDGSQVADEVVEAAGDRDGEVDPTADESLSDGESIEVRDVPKDSGEVLPDEALELEDALAEFTAPLEAPVPVAQVTDDQVRRSAEIVSSITERDLVNSNVVIDGRLITMLSLGGVHKPVHELTQSILTSLYTKDDHSEVQVEFNSSPLPKVNVKSWDENQKKIEEYIALRDVHYQRSGPSLKPAEKMRLETLERELTALMPFEQRPPIQTETRGFNVDRVDRSQFPQKKKPKEPAENATFEQKLAYDKKLAKWEEAEAERRAAISAAEEEMRWQRKLRSRLDDEKLGFIPERVIKAINISAGVIAHLENVDQFAAILAYSLAVDNPKVYGVIEDAKFRSKLDQHREFTDRNKEEQEIIKVSISVMERLQKAGYHPMALMEYERDVLEWIRTEFIDKHGYRFGRAKLTESLKQMTGGALDIEDPMRVPRHTLMQIYFSWLMQNADMQSLAYHEFPQSVRKWVKANKILVRPLYSKWYSWALPTGVTSSAGITGGTIWFGSESLFGGLAAFISNIGGQAGAYISTGAGTIGSTLAETGLLTSANLMTAGGIVAVITGAFVSRALVLKHKDKILEALSKKPRLRINGGFRLAPPKLPKIKLPRLKMPRIQWRRQRTLEQAAPRTALPKPAERTSVSTTSVERDSAPRTEVPRATSLDRPEEAAVFSELVADEVNDFGERDQSIADNRSLVPAQSRQVLVLSDYDPRPFLRNQSRALYEGGVLVVQRTKSAVIDRAQRTRDGFVNGVIATKDGIVAGSTYTYHTAIAVKDGTIAGGKRLVIFSKNVTLSTINGGLKLGASGIKLGTAVVVGAGVGLLQIGIAGKNLVVRTGVGAKNVTVRTAVGAKNVTYRVIGRAKDKGVALIDWGAQKTEGVQTAYRNSRIIREQRRRELALLKSIGQKDPSQTDLEDLKQLTGSTRNFIRLHHDTPMKKRRILPGRTTNLPAPTVKETAPANQLETYGLTSRSLEVHYVRLIAELVRIVEAKVISLDQLKELLAGSSYELGQPYMQDKLDLQTELYKLDKALVKNYPEIYSEDFSEKHIVTHARFFSDLNEASIKKDYPMLLNTLQSLHDRSLRRTLIQIQSDHFVGFLKYGLAKDTPEDLRKLALRAASDYIETIRLPLNAATINYYVMRHLSPEEKVVAIMQSSRLGLESKTMRRRRNSLPMLLLRTHKTYDGVKRYLDESIGNRGVNTQPLVSSIVSLDQPNRISTFEDVQSFMDLYNIDGQSKPGISTVKKVLSLFIEKYKGQKVPSEIVDQFNDFMTLALGEDEVGKIDQTLMDLSAEFYQLAMSSNYQEKIGPVSSSMASSFSPLNWGYIASNLKEPASSYTYEIFEAFKDVLNTRFVDPLFLKKSFHSWAFEILNGLTSVGSFSSLSETSEEITRFLAIAFKKHRIFNLASFTTNKEMRGLVTKLSFPQQAFLYYFTKKSTLIDLAEIKRPYAFFTKKQLKEMDYQIARKLVFEEGSLSTTLKVWDADYEPRYMKVGHFIQVMLDEVAKSQSEKDGTPSSTYKLNSHEDVVALQKLLIMAGTDSDSKDTLLYYTRILVRAFNRSPGLMAIPTNISSRSEAEKFIEDLRKYFSFADFSDYGLKTDYLKDSFTNHGLRLELANWYQRLLSNKELVSGAPEISKPTDKDPILLWARYFYDIREMGSKFDGKRLVQIFDAMGRFEKYDYLTELFRKHGSKLASYLLSVESTTDERQIVFKTINDLAKSGRLGHQAAENIILKKLNADQRATWESFKSQYEFTDYSVGWWNRTFGQKGGVQHAILVQISSAVSVRGLSNYIIEKFKASGGNPRHYDKMLHDEVINKAKLFKGLDDVMDFLKQDFYWPETDFDLSDKSSWKPLEEPFLKLLESKANNPNANKGSWVYPPAFSEKAHGRLISVLQATGSYPTEFSKKVDLWKALTSRGVTTFTDGILDELLEQADDQSRDDLLDIAINQDRIFDTKTRDEFAIDKVTESEDYSRLLESEDLDERMELLEKVVEHLQTRMPDRGLRYEEFLENLSVQIMSNQSESKFIHSQKGYSKSQSQADNAAEAVDEAVSAGKGAQSTSDLNVKTLDELIRRVEDWEPEEQFQFLRFLRGDRTEATSFLQDEFPNIGPERIRHIYQNLPTEYKIGLMTLFMSRTFLRNSKMPVDKGYPKKIIDEIVGVGDDANTQMTRAILTAGLVALKESAIPTLQSSIFGNILAVEKGKKGSVGKTLRIVLEKGFGPLGTKIAQQIVALQVLAHEDALELLETQDNTGLLEREEQFMELREILSAKGKFPFEMLDFKGGASLKWAIKALWLPAKLAQGSEKAKGDEVILKIIRDGAANFTRNRYKVLNHMVKYLIEHSGPEFGILRAIVDTARSGVERELVPTDEVTKSERARDFIYINLDDPESKVLVPKELVVPKSGNRIILSHFAEGESFHKLPVEVRPLVAKKILEMEGNNLFSDKDIIEYDPDRHAGNYRIWLKNYDEGRHLVLEPIQYGVIDMGQLTSITKQERANIIDLFALAQIYAHSGANYWFDDKVAEMFNMDKATKERFRDLVRRYFPSNKLQKALAYYGLVSAIYESGFDPKELKKATSTEQLKSSINVSEAYFDFPRAIIQLMQYEPFMPAGVKSPSQILEEQVTARVNQLVSDFAVDNETALKWVNGWKKAKTLVTREKFVPIRPGMDVKELLDGGFELDRSLYEKTSPEALTVQPANYATSCQAVFFNNTPAIQTAIQ